MSEFTVFAWKEYFKQAFPKLHIATFSCFPRDKRLIDDTVTCKTPWGLFVVLKDLLDALKTQAKRPKRRYYHAQGVQKILSLCRDVCHKPSVKVDWDAILIRYDENAIHVAISILGNQGYSQPFKTFTINRHAKLYGLTV